MVKMEEWVGLEIETNLRGIKSPMFSKLLDFSGYGILLEQKGTENQLFFPWESVNYVALIPGQEKANVDAYIEKVIDMNVKAYQQQLQKLMEDYQTLQTQYLTLLSKETAKEMRSKFELWELSTIYQWSHLIREVDGLTPEDNQVRDKVARLIADLEPKVTIAPPKVNE